jgi:hypothetical protein
LIQYAEIVRAPLICVVLLAFALPGTQISAQSATRPDTAAPVHNSYFSGFVADVTPTSVTISRDGPNKELVRRQFVIDSQTKVEGKLRVKARVTVRYEPRPEGDRAIRIIVRAN